MIIKKTKKFYWTNHCKDKMRFYGLSESRIKRVVNVPKRIEEGIAPNTIALMQEGGSKAHPYEIWVMIEEKALVYNIISAWKYPGKTKENKGDLTNILAREYSEWLAK